MDARAGRITETPSEGPAPDTSPGMVVRAVADAPGPPEALTLRRGPVAVPRAGEVLIVVEAAGVASGDVQARQGTLPARFPYTPGYDVVGRVSAVGRGVTGIRIGQRVAAYTGIGGNASATIAKAVLCVPVPDDIPAERLCALALNYTTAWQMLHRVASVPAGGSILVLGAAGGVGSALAELAQAEGLTVYGTASPARRPLLTDRGLQALSDAGAVPAPVDATFDGIGGASLAASRRATKRSGTVVSYGVSGAASSGASKAQAIGGLMVAMARSRLTRGARVTFYAISRTTAKDPGAFRTDLTHLVDLLRDGVLDPLVTSDAPGPGRRSPPPTAGPPGRGQAGAPALTAAGDASITSRAQQSVTRVMTRASRPTSGSPRDCRDRERSPARRVWGTCGPV